MAKGGGIKANVASAGSAAASAAAPVAVAAPMPTNADLVAEIRAIPRNTFNAMVSVEAAEYRGKVEVTVRDPRAGRTHILTLDPVAHAGKAQAEITRALNAGAKKTASNRRYFGGES